MKKKINVLNVNIDALTKEELFDKIDKSLVSGEKTNIFTPNPQILVKSSDDEKIKNMLNEASILIADGSGVILGARILGTPLPEQLTGIDTAEYILGVCSQRGYSVFLLGGKDEVVKKAKEELEKKYKGINICGIHDGYFEARGKQNEQVIKQINKANPDVLFVCMGFPRQEVWISENIDKLTSVCVSIGLGGSLDVWSGKVRRAPRIFRTISMEWLWRIMVEPKRIKFIPVIPIFIIKILKQKVKNANK